MCRRGEAQQRVLCLMNRSASLGNYSGRRAVDNIMWSCEKECRLLTRSALYYARMDPLWAAVDIRGCCAGGDETTAIYEYSSAMCLVGEGGRSREINETESKLNGTGSRDI